MYMTYTIVMRPRNRKVTRQALKELALTVYNSQGVIRKLSNEGIIRPYRKFRDSNSTVNLYSRYIVMSVDLGQAAHGKLDKVLRDHPDVMHHSVADVEQFVPLARTKDFFPLDTFARPEEEVFWPPQTNSNIYEQLEMNWKEFSRTRWSDYLRQ